MDSDQLQSKFFKALMHPARLAILDILREGEACVCHMEATLGYRQAYISQHLMVLREVGLVEDHRDGWNVFYRVTKPEVFTVLDVARQLLGVPVSAGAPTPSETCPCPHCQKAKEARLQVEV